MLTTLKAPYTEWGHTMPAFFTTPSDYDANPTKKYPVILFFHGKGEAGTDINRVLGNFLPAKAKAGDIIGTTPAGIQEKFIVVGGQDQYWSPYPPNFRKAYEYIVSTYKLRVDPNRIYATGLSAGGQTSLMYGCFDSSFVGKVAAIASLSPAAIEEKVKPNLALMGKAGTPVWFWSGSTDTHFTDNAKAYTKAINDAAGKVVASTTVFTGGHCCWNNVYSGSVKIKGMNGQDLSLYDWLLQFSLGTTPDPEVPKKYIFSATFDNLPTVYPVSVTMSDGSIVKVDMIVQ